MLYKHTQIGFVMIAGLGIAALVSILEGWVLLAMVFGFAGVLFSALTVSMDGESVRLWFGPGFIPKRFVLEDMESCQAVDLRVTPQRSWLGPRLFWGICACPGKYWIYNVSGFRAVELKMRSGMIYYIGTDQPEALEKVILDGLHTRRHRAFKAD